MSSFDAALQAELQRVVRDCEKFMSAHKERYGEVNAKQGELHARLLDVEQKLARRGEPDGTHGGDLRPLIEASADSLLAVAAGKAPRAVIDLPRGFFSPQAAITTGSGMPFPQQSPDILRPAERRLTIRSLLPSIPANSNAYQYVRETGFTNNVAPVSEGDEKPESDISFSLETAAIVVLATWLRCSAQVLSDVNMLQAYIDGRLRYALALVEENQLLKGSGVGNNLSGLYTAATVFTESEAGTKIDRLRAAIGQLEATFFEASGIIIHPDDFMDIQLIKSTTNEYIYGNPGGSNPARLWNLPVVATPAMTAGTFLVGDFRSAAVILDREEARVDVSLHDRDNFIRNLATVRVEERLGLAILRPGALIRGSL